MKRPGKFKIQRQLGTLLPGLGDKKAKGPLSKRAYPPGQHGQRRRKISEFGLRLREKQKIRAHYGVKEYQLVNLIKKAKKKDSNWFNVLTYLLECRVDNLLFRLGFAPTIPMARQMVVHGNVLVDGKVIKTPSYTISVGQKISLSEKMTKNIIVEKTRKEPTLPLPSFVALEKEGDKEIGRLVELPVREHIPFELTPQYVIEYYGRVK